MSGASSTATDWMALAMGRYGYFDSVDGKYTYLIDDGTGYTCLLYTSSYDKEYAASAFKYRRMNINKYK